VAVAITPPKSRGVIEIKTNIMQGEFVLAQYSTPATASMEVIADGSKGTVTTTDGTLAGTTGVDGDLTVRADSASGEIYVENRTGGTRNIFVTFRDAAPD